MHVSAPSTDHVIEFGSFSRGLLLETVGDGLGSRTVDAAVPIIQRPECLVQFNLCRNFKVDIGMLRLKGFNQGGSKLVNIHKIFSPPRNRNHLILCNHSTAHQQQQRYQKDEKGFLVHCLSPNFDKELDILFW